ncbi:VanZ family protein [Rhodobacteraceae bacterium KMM 6894]|nr:VanZ family protein [Rhodobacteraceae bacterium KMM 6894]
MFVIQSHRHLPLAWGATALMCVVIVVLTLMPSSQADGPPSPDKLYHFIAFAALVVPLSVVCPRHVWWIVAGATAFGGLIEVIQPTFGRGAEWLDLLADFLGAVVGALCAWRWVRSR